MFYWPRLAPDWWTAFAGLALEVWQSVGAEPLENSMLAFCLDNNCLPLTSLEGCLRVVDIVTEPATVLAPKVGSGFESEMGIEQA